MVNFIDAGQGVLAIIQTSQGEFLKTNIRKNYLQNLISKTYGTNHFMKQLKLFKENYKREFGGELLKGKRKIKRPLNIKQPLHLVLRANTRKPIFLAPQKEIDATIRKFAAKFNIKICENSVNATHLHLLIQFVDRKSYTRFVCAISGRLAQQLEFSWLHIPFTRSVSWGRDLKSVTLYIIKNQKEAWGIIGYQLRRRTPVATRASKAR